MVRAGSFARKLVKGYEVILEKRTMVVGDGGADVEVTD